MRLAYKGDHSAFYPIIFTKLGYSNPPANDQINNYLSFHRTVYLNFLQISITKFKLGDSFIRCSDNYYRVHVIFKHLGICYLLCEIIKCSKRVSIKIQHPTTKQEYKTRLKHHSIVDELDTKEYHLFQLKDIKKQVCFVELHQNLAARIQKKFTIIEMFN